MLLNSLVHKLLRHLGYSVPSNPAEILPVTLKAFSNIPYENLSKIVRCHESHEGTPKETPEEVIDGFIAHGTGGTCFPLTRTLVYLLKSLGYEAYPILADRRYGADTHCAAIVRPTGAGWHLLDPGYLMHTPCLIPTSGSERFELPVAPIELKLSPCSSCLDLFTLRPDGRGGIESRYRLTYKLTPVDEAVFEQAWDRSFSWDMMRYPVISILANETHVYLQKDSLLVRTHAHSERRQVSGADSTVNVIRSFGIDSTVTRKALALLQR